MIHIRNVIFRRSLSIVFLSVFLLFLVNTTKKNTCTSYIDYVLINFGGECHYNEDADLDALKILQKHADNVQTYSVTTQDGYILTMFRLYHKNPVGIILLQPPISTGSMAYLQDGHHSIAIKLWKKGYDVWLPNHRGMLFSDKHVNYTKSDPEFWNYSFHEIALYDLEAQFEIIGKETNSKITYIGYSMAGTEALIYASLKPEKAAKIVNNFILVAPLVTLEHFSSPFRYLVYAMNYFESFFKKGEFATFEVVRKVVEPLTILPSIVSFMTTVVMGWTPGEMDPSQFPYIFAHHGRRITNKMIFHYGQLISNQSYFLMYDYGREANLELYRSEQPPSYPLQNIKNNIYIVYGDSDKLANPSDIKYLCKNLLPKNVIQDIIEISNHNHIDYFFSRYRNEKIYKIIFQILDKIYNL